MFFIKYEPLRGPEVMMLRGHDVSHEKKQKWLNKVTYMLQFLKKLKLYNNLVPETVCTLSIHIKIYVDHFHITISSTKVYFKTETSY